MTSNEWEISDEEFFTIETGNDENEAEQMAELAEDFGGYEDFDFYWTVQRVADRIYNIHAERNLPNRFVYSMTCNADGEIDGGVVCLDIPQTSLYLNSSVEPKRLTNDRSATGREGVLAIKAALLDFEYRNIRRMAEVWGLVHYIDEDEETGA